MDVMYLGFLTLIAFAVCDEAVAASGNESV